MDSLPDDVFDIMLQFIGFGREPGRTIISCQRVSKRFCTRIESVRFEIDHDVFVSLSHFRQIYHRLYLLLKQKRDSHILWDDYRGYLVITDYNRDEWLYYNRLVTMYFFRPMSDDFPYYHGQIFFYDFPSFL
jgi:hypothetical protein